jgi:hypothetical protein
MGTTKQDLHRWFKEGVEQKATHMIVVCDTFDYEDYPVYVAKGEDVKAREQEYRGKDMQKVMEVYDLSKSWAEQSEGLVFNY